jgi:hypothetical protein
VPHMTELVVAPGYRESEREGKAKKEKGKENENTSVLRAKCYVCRRKFAAKPRFGWGLGKEQRSV